MTRIQWWFIDVTSRLLEPGERDAVRGDIEESGESIGQALRDVVGLIIRRQTALWGYWQVWAGFLCLVIPLGVLLSLLVRWFAEGSAIYSFLYLNNWTWSFVTIPGARRDLFQYSLGFFLNFVSLVCWSWTTGFVLGALSRSAIWVNGTLLLCIVLGEFLLVRQPHNPFNAAVFALTFYDVVFPALLRVLLVALPIFLGMCRGFRHGTLPFRQATLWAVAVALLTTRAARIVQMSAILSWWHFDGRIDSGIVLLPSWQLQLLPFALAWPAAYIVGTAAWDRRRFASV